MSFDLPEEILIISKTLYLHFKGKIEFNDILSEVYFFHLTENKSGNWARTYYGVRDLYVARRKNAKRLIPLEKVIHLLKTEDTHPDLLIWDLEKNLTGEETFFVKLKYDGYKLKEIADLFDITYRSCRTKQDNIRKKVKDKDII